MSMYSNKLRKQLLLSTVAAGAISLFSHPVSAASELLELLEVLRQNGTLNEAQYQRLRNEALATQQREEEARIAEEQAAEEEQEEEVSVSVKGGALKFKTEDEAFAVQIGGRLMVDGALYDDDDVKLGDGTEFRRARLFVEGTMWRVWDYKLQYDFTESGSEGIRDAYIRYTGFDPTTITLGNFKEWFSLEELTSSKYITFMERALPNAFVPGRHIGAGVFTHGANWSVSGGLFSEGTDSNQDSETNEGWGLNARATFAPIYDDNIAVHLGASGYWREPDSDNEVSFEERPESHVTNVRLVDTDTIDDVNSYYGIGGELAAVWGPFSAQGEYIYTNVDRDDASDPDFDGFYVFGSYFLTGESRNYDPEDGTFGRVKPFNPVDGGGGLGAWELTLRYSYIDLNDGAIKGGRENNYTAGLNWYATSHIRFMFNYIRVNAKREGIAGPGTKYDNANIYQARAQVDF